MILILADFLGGDGGDRVKYGGDRLQKVGRMEMNEIKGLRHKWRGWRGWRR
jgi:hypothetical protein